MRKEWPVDILEDVWKELSREVPGHLLEHELWATSPSAAAYWTKQRRFSRSHGVMAVIGFALGLGDRHLDNILLDFDTGTSEMKEEKEKEKVKSNEKEEEEEGAMSRASGFASPPIPAPSSSSSSSSHSYFCSIFFLLYTFFLQAKWCTSITMFASIVGCLCASLSASPSASLSSSNTP